MMVWLAEISLVPIVKLSSKEIGAILMIWKFIMYQTSCCLIVANNILLNYDLMQMIIRPHNRDVRKSINWTNFIAVLYVLIIYIAVPWVKMQSILYTPDKIKLRAEDTVINLLESTMFFPDCLLCFLYVCFNVKVLHVLF